ncbi:MAG: FAD-dependent oxidoreductase [Magnetococcales bacterium]|nr:FAD-dependent oxidoreductase [Magnetococcales bacterium]
MSNNITVTLNGHSTTAAPGATIRDVAEANGVHIPTFCHDDRLKPFASCFLCVVEVANARTLLPACSTRVTPGMVIDTDSPKVTHSRKTALDLLLSDHAGDCISPCEATCPANIDIQGYVAHIANGDFASAVHLIKQRNPLPVVCGRICPHPCESQCRRALVDEPVAINPLKRFSAEYELSHGPFVPTPAPNTGHKVAIIGGGPAGLSAAFYLRKAGHAVDIFEALPALGGMARYGIPRFRLPWELMDKEIQSIIGMGVTVHHNQRLGKDFSIADLKARGFGAILLAIGAHKAKPMRVPNEEVPGVIGGVDFLRKAVMDEPLHIGPGSRVAVVGGGDTAMDCARVARRQGSDVALLYRRTKKEMPASPVEQEETHEEGIDIQYLVAPVEVVLNEKGSAKALRVITMQLGEPDASGRRSPVPVPGSEKDLPFDLIIAAIGQDPDLTCLDKEADKPKTTRWNTIVYDEKTNVTSIPGVFAAGDCSFGPDILIRAIGEGRRAAMAIDLHLNGAEVTLKSAYAISRGRLAELDAADFQPRYVHQRRALETTHPPEKRLSNEGGWAPINIGLDAAQAMAEASRCILCGCAARFDCDLRHYSTLYGATEKRLAGDKRAYDVDSRHPLITIEPDKCITCASCVRMCSEVRDVHALSFINRGFGTRIGPTFDDPLQQTGCDACGMCVDLCPTGTLTLNFKQENGPWVSLAKQTTCAACSRGCGVVVHTTDGRVVKVTSIDGDPVNGANICAEGRFSYQLVGKEAVADPDTALTRAGEILAQAKDVAVVVSPFLTVEESYVAALLARAKGGKLYYPTDKEIVGPAKPMGKFRGEANVALLKRLGATPWQPNLSPGALVLVGTRVDSPGVDVARRILVGPYRGDATVAVFVQSADPLECEGTFLNRDGQLGRLRTVLGHAANRSVAKMLARLLHDSEVGKMDVIQQRLIKEIPELAPITSLHGDTARVVVTTLAPLLEPAMPDLRQARFKEHMQKMGLAWA